MKKEKLKYLIGGSLILVATGVYYITEIYKNALDMVARKAAGESEHEKFKRR